ncbi:MAG: glycosyltransferase [Planctomycetales bacterium]|nr:glycosyltransferase [Planctomycetales bacterium]
MSTQAEPQHDLATSPAPTGAPLRVGFVMHVMQVAGAEVLVAEIIRQLGDAIEPTIFCLDGIGPIGEQLQDEGVEVLCLDRRPGLDRRLAFRFAKEIRQRGIEVLHAHQYTPFFYSALARMAGARGVPIILTEHGRHYPDVVGAKRRWCNRLVLSRFANRINACCRFSAEALGELDGFPRDQVAVIYNGIDTSRFAQTLSPAAARERLGLSQDRQYVAMIARFHSVKDHATMLRAFRCVVDTRDDTDLLLVGDGQLRADMELLAQELGMAERVQFWGVRDDVATILQAVDVFALSSVSEAASLTLLEAMACGRPAVVTNVGGNPEIVQTEQTGLLAPRGDWRSFGEALLTLLNDPKTARRYGEAGRQLVLSRFRLEQAVDQHAKLYRELAPLRRGSHA